MIKRIVFWGTYDASIPRINVLIDGLRRHGVEVDTCSFMPKAYLKDRYNLKKYQLILFVIAIGLAQPFLLLRYLFLPSHQVVIIPYPSIIGVIFLYPFARLRGAVLVCDSFLPLYEMLIEDRKRILPESFLAKCLLTLERMCLRLTNKVLVDTNTHGKYLSSFYGLNPNKIFTVYVGAQEQYFPVIACKKTGNIFEVLFYGEFIPLHGISTIIYAASLLKYDNTIHFTIIGTGQESELADRLLAELELSNITRISRVPYQQLQGYISKADLGLGIFGNTTKAARVIPNKVFQMLHCGLPVITMDSEAIRELPPTSLLHYVPANNPKLLAEAILAKRNKEQSASVPVAINAKIVGKQFLAAL